MKAWGVFLVLVLVSPAAAQEKKAQEKKGPQAAGSASQLMAEAEQKAAAGDTEGAAKLLRKAAELPEADGQPSLRLGRLLEGAGELDNAIDAYKTASDRLSGPDKGEALGRLSLLQEIRGFPEATATAESAATADPAGVWPLVALSRARARERKGEEAVSLAQKAVAAGGGAAATTALGFAEEAAGDLAAAEKAYREVLAAEPGRVSASVGLARVLRKTGHAADAEPILQKVLEASPGAVDAYKESARVKLALGRAAEAMGDAATAAALAETDAEAKRLVDEVTIAQALDYVGRNQANIAVQELTKLRDEHPDMAEARLGLAKALIAQRQIDPALTELKKAVELAPDLAEAQYQLGYTLHVLKGDPAEAVGPYQKAVDAEPGNLAYRTHLGAALSDSGERDRAVTELTKVVETPGYDSAEAWIYLGGAYLGARKYQDAVTALQKAVAKAPDSALAEAYLAWSYFGLKDADNFKKHGARARSLGYKEPRLLDYLKRVEGGEAIK